MKSESLSKLAELLEKQATSINQISFDDIRSLQRVLKAEGLYEGTADADFGGGTARGLLEAFNANPSLLGNASPAIIKLMQEKGYGKDLQEIVAGNEDLRNKIIADTRELLTDDTFGKSYTLQQTKLSLLGLYNAKIDGVIGKGHRAATAAFDEQFPAAAPEEEKTNIVEHEETVSMQGTGGSLPDDVDEIVVTASRNAPPDFIVDLEDMGLPPITMPLLGETFSAEANTLGKPDIHIEPPQIIATSVLPIVPVNGTEVTTEPKAAVASSEPETGWIESTWNKLTGLFSDSAEDAEPESQALQTAATEGITFTVNEDGFSTPDFSLFKSFQLRSDPISRIDLHAAFLNVDPTYIDMDAYRPVLELIVQTEAEGHYDHANGHVDKGYTGMTINQVLDDQITWIRERRKAYDEAVENGEVDPDEVNVTQFEYEGRVSSGAGGIQAIHRTLKYTALDRLGLTGDELYDKPTQLKIGAELLRLAGYNDYLAGHIDRETITQNISQIWASFPENSDGTSPYENDGINRVLVAHNDVQDTLQLSKNLYTDNTTSTAFFSHDLFDTDGIGTLPSDQGDLALNSTFTGIPAGRLS